METLRERDWRSAVELLHEVSAAEGLRAFAETAVRALPRLVASEITTLSVCHLPTGRRQVVGTPAGAIGAADRAAFDRHFREHPLVRYHAGQRGPGAHRISDSLSFARFRASALYADYYRRIGIDHAIAVPLHVDDELLVSLVLNRRARDFSDHERTLLDAVGAPLGRLYRRSVREQALHEELAALRSLLPETGAADRPALLERLTPREREVLHWLAGGKTDRDIGELLACSHRTVHKHLQRIYVKLGVETRTAAVLRLLGRWPR